MVQADTIVHTARTFSENKHRHQIRKHDATPYSAHLESVVAILRRHAITAPPTIAAAYLHDTLEKTDTRIEELITLFGADIAQLVYWLTDDDRGDRKMRKLESTWRLSRAPWDAKLIKLADLIDNTRYAMQHDPASASAYALEKDRVMRTMAEIEGNRLTTHSLFQEALRAMPSGDHAARRGVD